MSQASAALPRAQAKPAAGSAAPAGPRFVKLLVAVALMPVAILLLTALCDLNFSGLIWNHPAAPSSADASTGGLANWRSLTRSLPGVLGLATIGLTLGLWWQPMTAPEGLLRRFAGRLFGAAEKPGADGSFLLRWLLFEMPLWSLLGVAVQALLRWLSQPVAADAVLVALPFCYGLYFAGLCQASKVDSDVCKHDGFLFTWVSSALMQLMWIAVGLVYFLQARPVWQFGLDWIQAVAVRAVRWLR
ncbi:MAG TPA: hypothetical protein VL860_14920 [Planctomycetota bacterium]|nr:hypothetical protein [Planctomycetota bacterium]